MGPTKVHGRSKKVRLNITGQSVAFCKCRWPGAGEQEEQEEEDDEDEAEAVGVRSGDNN